jgi:SAM domain (Sterile alpha motif)
MDIGGWLRSLGLEEYETAFRQNKVDAAVLPKLTAEDLKDLGVAAVGDRRKLLDAIADLQLGTKPETIPLDASSTVAGRADLAIRGQWVATRLSRWSPRPRPARAASLLRWPREVHGRTSETESAFPKVS